MSAPACCPRGAIDLGGDRLARGLGGLDDSEDLRTGPAGRAADLQGTGDSAIGNAAMERRYTERQNRRRFLIGEQGVNVVVRHFETSRLNLRGNEVCLFAVKRKRIEAGKSAALPENRASSLLNYRQAFPA
jgi:hypothetical protein